MQSRLELLLGVLQVSLCCENKTEIAARLIVFRIEAEHDLKFLPSFSKLIPTPKYQSQSIMGLVETGFSKVRFRGDAEQAKKVYEGVEPLTPDDIAGCVLFAVTRPAHMNIDELVVKALAQSTPVRIVRDQ